MPLKYRRLTIDELTEMEKEFVEFLVINGITADDWNEMKENQSQNSEKIVDAFSDVVFEGIMRKTQFVDFISSSSLLAFHCQGDKMILRGLESSSPDVDFTSPAITDKLKMKEYQRHLKVISHEKEYSSNREEEIFRMIETGCHISDGSWFKVIALLSVEG